MLNLEGCFFIVIHEAVEKLEKLDEQGVTKIVAVPLFISSVSGHIEEIEYVLGLREELPESALAARTRAFVEGVEMERSVVESSDGRYFVSYTPLGAGARARHGRPKQVQDQNSDARGEEGVQGVEGGLGG